MPYKYGPGDPELLGHDADRESGASPYFDGFRRKLAMVDIALVAGAAVAALALGWDFHRFVGMLALAGVGTIGLGMLAFIGNQSLIAGGVGRMTIDPLGPRLPIDHWGRRISVLLLVAGLPLAVIGVALVLVS